MDMHRGRSGGNQGFHHYRNPRGTPRFSDGHPDNRLGRKDYQGGFHGDGFRAYPSFRPFNSSPWHAGADRGVGGGFQAMPRIGDFNLNPHVPMPGQKRANPFPERGGPSPPDYFERASFAKLFVGSIPRKSTENDIRPLFEKHGNVLEVALIKDRRTGLQQGCCFIKYATSEEADRAIMALHNQYTLPGGFGPIQVRYADGERERLGATEHKLFVGSLSKLATESEIEEIFSPYGQVEDVYLMRDEMKMSRGCGFVKFLRRDMAMAAIDALNGLYTMRGGEQPLIVRFADPKRPRAVEARGDFGVSGKVPPFTDPRPRLEQGVNDRINGPMPTSLWHSISAPSSTAVSHSFGDYPFPMSRDAAASSSWGKNSLHADVTLSTIQQSSDFVPPQMRPPSHLLSLVKKPLLSPQSLPLELQPYPASYSHAHPRLNELGQAFPSQHELHSQQSLPSAVNAISQSIAVMSQHQSSMFLQQKIAQHVPQSPSQLSQFPSQSRPENFQQHVFDKLPQQYQGSLTSIQTGFPTQSTLNSEQQVSQWTGLVQQATVSASAPFAANIPSTTTAPTVPVSVHTMAPTKCNWTEHTSPDGYKYYYNSVTGESRWEKPEELTLYEQHQLQLKFPAEQQLPSQLPAQGQYVQQISQGQLLLFQAPSQLHNPHQMQQHFLPSSVSAVAGFQNMQDSASVNRNTLLLLQGPQSQSQAPPHGWIPKHKLTGA